MRFIFLSFLMLYYDSAVASSTISYSCGMNKHVILMDDITSDGNLSLFEFHVDRKKLWFDSPAYFGDAEFQVVALSKNKIKAIDGDKTFFYQRGRFHFSFISHSHVTSMSGNCKSVATLKQTAFESRNFKQPY